MKLSIAILLFTLTSLGVLAAGSTPIHNGVLEDSLNANGKAINGAGAVTATSYNGLTVTTTTGSLDIANGKSFTALNALTLTGTDGSTLNVGAGGTLGSASYMYPPPPGSIVVIIGDSIQTNSPSGVYPAQVLSALPAFAGIPVYDYAIGGTTAGPSSSTTNSGLYILAASSPAYVEFLNGTQVATGNASLSSLYSGTTGDFILYAMFGANDVDGVNSETPTQFITAMNSIATTVHGYGSHAKVIFPTITDSPRVDPSVLAQWNQLLSAQTMAIAGAGSGFADYLADEHSFFSNLTTSAGGVALNVWTSDGVHPTAIAVPVNAGIMADAYLRRITQPHDLSGPWATTDQNTFNGTQVITAPSGTYPTALWALASGLPIGGEVSLQVGLSEGGVGNEAGFGFVNNGGVGSTSNQATLGLGNTGNNLRVDGLGNGIFYGSATADAGFIDATSGHTNAVVKFNSGGVLVPAVAGTDYLAPAAITNAAFTNVANTFTAAQTVAALIVTSGTNAKAGTFTLTAGSATVANTSITASSVVHVTLKTLGGTRAGNPDIVPTAGIGFTATAASSDTSTYNYWIEN